MPCSLMTGVLAMAASIALLTGVAQQQPSPPRTPQPSVQTTKIRTTSPRITSPHESTTSTLSTASPRAALVTGGARQTFSTQTFPDNPLINYAAFAEQVRNVGQLREQRRVSVQDFARMAADRSTIVLDARSREKFALLHIAGAKNLPLPDFTEDDLKRLIPDQNTRILIYCNNNFRDDPVAFATKRPVASLNVHTFNVLHSYGYTNVYELGPLLSVDTPELQFAGTRSARRDTGKGDSAKAEQADGEQASDSQAASASTAAVGRAAASERAAAATAVDHAEQTTGHNR